MTGLVPLCSLGPSFPVLSQLAFLQIHSKSFRKEVDMTPCPLEGQVATLCSCSFPQDYTDTETLLRAENVNQDNLLSYAREAADFATNYQLPSLDFAMNHYGQPDVAMFDFTSMYASENAALVRERQSHLLLVALVGDSLLEPFWPMGTGCARGFLAAFDTAWMVKSWDQGTSPLELLAERESLYRLLPQTTPENINKNFEQYTLDPATRYPNLNSNNIKPNQVRPCLESCLGHCALSGRKGWSPKILAQSWDRGHQCLLA